MTTTTTTTTTTAMVAGVTASAAMMTAAWSNSEFTDLLTTARINALRLVFFQAEIDNERRKYWSMQFALSNYKYILYISLLHYNVAALII